MPVVWVADGSYTCSGDIPKRFDVDGERVERARASLSPVPSHFELFSTASTRHLRRTQTTPSRIDKAYNRTTRLAAWVSSREVSTPVVDNTGSFSDIDKSRRRRWTVYNATNTDIPTQHPDIGRLPRSWVRCPASMNDEWDRQRCRRRLFTHAIVVPFEPRPSRQHVRTGKWWPFEVKRSSRHC